MTYDDRQFSVRVSIFLWIMLAAAFWVGLGMLVNVMTHWQPITADADHALNQARKVTQIVASR